MATCKGDFPSLSTRFRETLFCTSKSAKRVACVGSSEKLAKSKWKRFELLLFSKVGSAPYFSMSSIVSPNWHLNTV